MNHEIFIKAYELLKASGSSYEELISPFWSDVKDGVVLPTLGKVIPRLAPERLECPWDEAMADAAVVGLTLPSIEELLYIYHHLDQINVLLVTHKGNYLPHGMSFWSRTEYNPDNAWGVNFGLGYVIIGNKSIDMYSMALSEFKIH